MQWCKVNQNLRRLSLLFVCLSFFSCSTKPIYNSGAVPSVNKNEYESIIKKHTRHDRQYSGFYQTYEVKGTLLTTEVNQILLQKKGFYRQWSAENERKEREKIMQSMSYETSLFFSFFTPDREHNDLNKETTIWRVYLEVDGIRYDGRIKKHNAKPANLKHFFPYHNSWSIPYLVFFKVPVTAVEQAHSKVIFTSSIGTTVFEFPKFK